MKKKIIVSFLVMYLFAFTELRATSSIVPLRIFIEDTNNPPHRSPAKAIIISYDNLMQMVYVTFNRSYSNVEMILMKDGMIVGNSVIGDAEAGMTEVLSLSEYGAGCYEVYIAIDGAVSATAQIMVK